MSGNRPVNLSEQFQVYRARKLLGSFHTVQEARDFLTGLKPSEKFEAHIVYPASAIHAANMARALPLKGKKRAQYLEEKRIHGNFHFYNKGAQ